MKKNTFQTLLRTAIAVVTVLVITATVTVAEVPRKTAAALQNQSPEKLLIEVQTFEKKRNGVGGFDLEISARVLEVEKSETELTKGDSLTIRYWLHAPEKPVPSGSYPIEIEKGKTYRAYLGPPVGAYRRPVKDDEVKSILRLFTKVRPTSESFEDAIREMLALVLVSPDFLYLVEPENAEGSSKTPLTDFEFASRLSYFLWSTMPDARLFELAESGTLREPAILTSEIDRMLAEDNSVTLHLEVSVQRHDK